MDSKIDIVLNIVRQNTNLDINDIVLCKDIVRHTLINKYLYEDSNNTSYWCYYGLKLGFTNIKITDDLKDAKRKFKLNILIQDFEKEVVDLEKKFEYFLVACHLIDKCRINEYKKSNKELLLDFFKNYFENGFPYSFIDRDFFTLFNYNNFHERSIIVQNTIRYFKLKGCLEQNIYDINFRNSLSQILVLTRCMVYFKNTPILKYSYNGYVSDYIKLNFDSSSRIKFRQLDHIDIDNKFEISVYNTILLEKLNKNEDGQIILEHEEYIRNFRIIPSKFYVI